MKTERFLMSFKNLVEKLREHGINEWSGVLVSQTIQQVDVSNNDLTERLRDTWWEVAWTIGTQEDAPECRYLADSLPDALRSRPRIPIATGVDMRCSAREFIALIDQWQETEEDSEAYWYD